MNSLTLCGVLKLAESRLLAHEELVGHAGPHGVADVQVVELDVTDDELTVGVEVLDPLQDGGVELHVGHSIPLESGAGAQRVDELVELLDEQGGVVLVRLGDGRTADTAEQLADLVEFDRRPDPVDLIVDALQEGGVELSRSTRQADRLAEPVEELGVVLLEPGVVGEGDGDLVHDLRRVDGGVRGTTGEAECRADRVDLRAGGRERGLGRRLLQVGDLVAETLVLLCELPVGLLGDGHLAEPVGDCRRHLERRDVLVVEDVLGQGPDRPEGVGRVRARRARQREAGRSDDDRTVGVGRDGVVQRELLAAHQLGQCTDDGGGLVGVALGGAVDGGLEAEHDLAVADLGGIDGSVPLFFLHDLGGRDGGSGVDGGDGEALA